MLCALIYFPRLGDDGYASSEGQRAIPAWTMLGTGDWLVPRLFEIPYVRKPPGIFWAIAARAPSVRGSAATKAATIASAYFGKRGKCTRR